MSSATKTDAKTVTNADILRAIGEHYAEFMDWPEHCEIVAKLGPVHGLTSMLAAMKAAGLVELTVCGSVQRVEICLPSHERDWYKVRFKVNALGRWLVDVLQFDGKELQSYHERPWKWSQEYAVTLAIGGAA